MCSTCPTLIILQTTKTTWNIYTYNPSLLETLDTSVSLFCSFAHM